MYSKDLKKIFRLIFLLTLFILPVGASPVSYLTEQVNAEFDYNGTLISQENLGYVEVELFNSVDVLQNIEITLSGTANTNLEESRAYSAVGASPAIGDKTKLYLNTNESNETNYYKFYNASIVNITINYQNEKGGKDLAPGKNRINFELFLSASEDLSGVEFNVRAKKDTCGENDSLNFVSANSTTGVVSLIDRDSDGFKDNLKWNGNLSKTATINFTAEISPDINYPGDELVIDIDSQESLFNYSQPSTFTGISFSDRFTRGPVRQGVEITAKINWSVKGFMKNIAHGLTYYIDSWSLYKVGENESSASKTVGEPIYPVGGTATSSVFSCEENHTICTDEYDTGIPVNFTPEHIAEKTPEVYYSAAFNWNVLWGGSEYFGIINEKVNLPKLYQMDLGLDKRIDIIRNDESGRTLSIEDEIKHLGHANLQIRDLYINISGMEGWSCSNLKIFYINNTNKIEITNYTTESSNDILEVKIINISNDIQQNDIISVEYNLSEGSEDKNKIYIFGLTVTATTKSGTPVEKNLTEEIEVPGIIKDEGGGGGAGAPEIRKILEILKISATTKFITDSVIENNVSFKIIDTGDKGVRDFVFFLYLPEESYINLNKIEAFLLRKNTKERLDINIEKTGVKAIGTKNYQELVIQKKVEPTEKFVLYDKDVIQILFQCSVPLGTSETIIRAYGYNYYEDKHIFEDVIIKVRREYWKLENLVIKESKFEGKKIIVGKPAGWVKTIEIYNPNERKIKDIYTTEVFGDRLNVKVMESKNGSTNEIRIEKEEETGISFFVDIGPKERITYFINIKTSPVLEIKRIIDILEIKNGSVKVELDIILKNFARLDYKNIYLELPIKNILECNFNYTTEENKTEIKIPKMKSLENVSVYIVYEEEPPILKIYLDKLKYNCNEKVNITYIAVQTEKKGYLEIEVNGPEKSLNTIYANLISLEKISGKNSIEFELGTSPTGNYTVYAYYKSNFHPILVAKESFSVECGKVFELHWIILVIVAAIIIILSIRRIYRKRSLEEEIRRSLG